jgi:hypothetical protein
MSQSYSTHSSPVAPDYIVVVSNEDDYHSSFHHFAEKVNRKLRAGYQLHGQPFNINQTLCQAMLRLEGAQSTGDTTVYYKQPDNLHLM